MKKIYMLASLLLLFGAVTNSVEGQTISSLDIHPDVRGTGLAQSSVSLDGNASSIYKNTSAISFATASHAASYSFTKWYGKNRLHALSGYYQLNDRHSLGLGVRYFDAEKVVNTTDGIQLQEVSPYDVLLDLGYAFRVNTELSLSANLRYIHSKLNEGPEIDRGNGWGADFGFTYRKDQLSVGGSVTGLGSKIDYGFDKYQMPATLNLGTSYALVVADSHQFTGALEGNYRMMPSDYSTFGAGAGLEYKYADCVALRGGYRIGDKEKSPGSYGVIGGGVYYKLLAVDFAYIIAKHNSIIKDVWQISLGVRF